MRNLMARPKFKKQIDCSTFGCFSQIFDECNSFCEDVKQNKQSLQIKLNVWENENVDDIWELWTFFFSGHLETLGSFWKNEAFLHSI